MSSLPNPPIVTIVDNETVSREAFITIRRMLVAGGAMMRTDAAADLPVSFDLRWTTEERDAWGTVGTFPTRVSQYIHKAYHHKLKVKVLEEIGQIAKRSCLSNNVHFDFTRRIDWQRGDFGDEASCYWGTNAISINYLHDEPAFAAMRFWRTNSPKQTTGVGRIWTLQRYIQGHPCVYAFNAYGKLQLTPAARVLADWLNMGYTPITSLFNSSGEGVFYTNGNRGVIIHPRQFTPDPTKSYDLGIRCPGRECDFCKREYPPRHGDRAFELLAETYGLTCFTCKNCFNNHFKRCAYCGDFWWVGAMKNDRCNRHQVSPYINVDNHFR